MIPIELQVYENGIPIRRIFASIADDGTGLIKTADLNVKVGQELRGANFSKVVKTKTVREVGKSFIMDIGV